MDEYCMPPPLNIPNMFFLLLIKPKGWSERILQDSPLPECPPFSVPGGHTHPLGSTEEDYNSLYSQVHNFNGGDNSKTQGGHVTGNCKRKLSNNKGRATEMTDVWPNSSHQILTCINAEPTKVCESITLYGPKDQSVETCSKDFKSI